MKKYIYLFVLLFFVSCNPGKNIISPESLVMAYEKTGCYGNCPVYKIWVFNSGNVFFEGIEHVENTGMYKAKLSTAQLSSLRNKFSETDFYSFENQYINPNVKDIPTTFIYYSDNKRDKLVQDYYDAPEKLKELEDFIENTLLDLNYRSINGKPALPDIRSLQ